MSTPEQYMREGSNALNQGNTRLALSHFSNARESASDNNSQAQAGQLLGVCKRMLGDYNDAEEAFEEAFRLARTRILKGKIKRDWCMVPLEQGNIGRAMKYIDGSLELLKYDKQSDPEDTRPLEEQEAERKLEYFASLGFRSRIDARTGNIGRARIGYKTAREGLKGHHPYELNTTVWELKIAPFGLRWELFPRAFMLARKAHNYKRCIQVLLLTFCRPVGLQFDKN